MTEQNSTLNREFCVFTLNEPVAINFKPKEIEGNLKAIRWAWLESIASVVIELIHALFKDYSASAKSHEILYEREDQMALAGLRVTVISESAIPDELWDKAVKLAFIPIGNLASNRDAGQMPLFEQESITLEIKKTLDEIELNARRRIGGTQTPVPTTYSAGGLSGIISGRLAPKPVIIRTEDEENKFSGILTTLDRHNREIHIKCGSGKPLKIVFNANRDYRSLVDAFMTPLTVNLHVEGIYLRTTNPSGQEMNLMVSWETKQEGEGFDLS